MNSPKKLQKFLDESGKDHHTRNQEFPDVSILPTFVQQHDYYSSRKSQKCKSRSPQ